MLQVHVGRNSETTGITSRDRIRHLEDNVASLWSVVRELRSERGLANSEAPTHDGAQARQSAADSDSEASEMSPMNPPAHLQQLFDNEFLDSHGNDTMSSDIGSDKVSTAQLARARGRLQALMPPKEDVQAIFTPAAMWISLYNALFPAISMFTNAGELLARYESLQEPDANPVQIASLLISVAITVVQKPPEMTSRLVGIKDTALYVRKVTTAVEEVLVSNDALAGTLEGIETTLLYIRLYVSSVNCHTHHPM